MDIPDCIEYLYNPLEKKQEKSRQCIPFFPLRFIHRTGKYAGRIERNVPSHSSAKYNREGNYPALAGRKIVSGNSRDNRNESRKCGYEATARQRKAKKDVEPIKKETR